MHAAAILSKRARDDGNEEKAAFYALAAKWNLFQSPCRNLSSALWFGLPTKKNGKNGFGLPTDPGMPTATALPQRAGEIDRVNAMAALVAAEQLGDGVDPQIAALTLNDVHDVEDRMATLRDDGIVLLPGLVPEGECRQLLANLKKPPKLKHLARSMGNGHGGAYIPKYSGGAVPALKRFQEDLAKLMQLKRDPDAGDEDENPVGVLPRGNNRTAVPLFYVEGGENFAHQDNNGAYPYQALLMLSEPGLDFSGGELCVLNGNDGTFKEHAVAFQRRGDVAVFRSGGGAESLWFHAMKEVKRGSRASTRRIAIGLLQPKPS